MRMWSGLGEKASHRDGRVSMLNGEKTKAIIELPSQTAR